MHFLDLTLPSCAENLALDEALLLEAEAGRGGEVLRVWEWPEPAVVLGASCRLAEDVDEAACRADGVQILRRASGGGTVLLNAGCLCYSLVLAYERSAFLLQIRSSYLYVFECIRAAFRDLIPNLQCAGISDLVLEGLKVSGNSQQRKRDHLLHHATLLYDFDPQPVGRYLRIPARQPEYRQERPHSTFLRNLPVARTELKRRLRSAWEAVDESKVWPEERARQLVVDKYISDDWIARL